MTELLTPPRLISRNNPDFAEPIKIQEITELPPADDTDMVGAGGEKLEQIVYRTLESPVHIPKKELDEHLTKLACLGYEFGLGLDVNKGFLEYEQMIRDKISAEFTFEGSSVHNMSLSNTIENAYANGAFVAFQENKASAKEASADLPLAS